MSAYFRNIKQAFGSMTEGLKLTLRYLADARKSREPIGVADERYFEADRGIVTLEYPYESLPVPDNARYRLHNEIDDCIVCDKCAKVCPVDCIDIESIKAKESFGETSDGTPKRIHAAKFDIDMSKCCFCGLCTTVCPTECLTMTKVYDFSEFDVQDHVYSFANMSLTEIAQKRKELEEHEAQKAAAKAAATSAKPAAANPAMRPRPKPAGAKPALKPKSADDQQAEGKKPVVKPKLAKPKVPGTSESGDATSDAKKPVMKPKTGKPVMKPKIQGKPTEGEAKAATNKPVVKPKMGKPVIKPKVQAKEEESSASPKKPVVKPKMKPVIKPKPTEAKDEEKAASKKPVIKPKIQAKKDDTGDAEKSKYRPRPVIRKKPKDDNGDQ